MKTKEEEKDYHKKYYEGSKSSIKTRQKLYHKKYYQKQKLLKLIPDF